mmetsp:Transcript_20283/g.28311  ORF Transcript_20283/g.28311 Transcript_20283/m.28311 type:complete len:604 (+) Transcript_20283:493-2304(+)
MGPSGSGKTTLMDILAGRKNVGQIEGEILYDGQAAAPIVYNRLTSYVEQFDTLVPDLTVKQFLMYTATLKLPSSTSPEEIEERVDEVIEKLSLGVCKNTVIGSELSRGISGGQAKRTNIAMALLTSPRIVFLDEPTTGLDSHMANEVVLLLKALAREGRTVVATIHSPTAFAFNQFDDIFLLESGKTIYTGPRGRNNKQLLSYFKSIGFGPRSQDSVVEWMVELISGRSLKSGGLTRESTGRFSSVRTDSQGYDNGDSKLALRHEAIKGDESDANEKALEEGKAGDKFDFQDAYNRSSMKQECQFEVANSVKKLKSQPASFDRREAVVSNSMIHGMKTIFRYRTLTHYSSGEFIGPRLGDKIIFSLLILSLYYGIGDKTDIQDMQSTASMLYFIVAILGYGAASFTPSLTLDRPLFYRERSDGLYTTTTYFLAKFCEEAFVAIFTSLLFTIVIFWGLDLQGNFGIFVLTYYLTAMCGIVLAYFIAAAVPTLEAANALLPTYVTICMFFGGLFIVYDKIPDGWQWFTWLCFLRYPWTALMLNQFDNDKFNDERRFDGQTILEFYGMDEGFTNDLWLNILVLACFMLWFAILAGFALAYIRHDSR